MNRDYSTPIIVSVLLIPITLVYWALWLTLWLPNKIKNIVGSLLQ